MPQHSAYGMQVTSVGLASTECDAVPKGAIPFYTFVTLSRGRSLFSLRERWCQKINVLREQLVCLEPGAP